mmetsp:Transcript_4097/g.6351  ORF Transcript_4097/g.6351 Transcript_4097/m.6351 type:complete len:130 (+) Transcript_4097:29-418(+)|eukprot:CAMPEP_0185021618 /NCGR_PEP_ID=MMETSP1103-20130426/4316_1 /TAXON_ID=36769 /ORGANISM="Paraphysomonas bandaiensis, Strain Caron Lab Isolate" /LENGTH=129 /DNA_ID=CAMNT_0027553253 /DNA_START=6 /DNA_END=395 /DNA_ORIENTATION=-
MSATLKNENLRAQLLRWVDLCDTAISHPVGSVERVAAIIDFCSTFVPPDISSEDMEAYAGELATDEEHFLSIRRELSQCASGSGVESIKGNQTTRAEFTLTPLEDTALDIVREISFISSDRGTTWTAEG